MSIDNNKVQITEPVHEYKESTVIGVKQEDNTRVNLKGIVFSDLDGTILDNGQNLIPDSTMEALDKLKANGYLIVLSTGRDMDTHYSVRYRAMIKPDAIIHHNGNKITIGDKLIFEHIMEDSLVHEIYEFCKKNGYCVGTSIGGEDFFLNPEIKLAADRSYKKLVERNFVPFEELFERKLPVSALSYAGDISVEKPIVEAAFPCIQLFPFNGGRGADMIERGFSKAEGFKKVCAYYGLSEEDCSDKTYAIGDSHNDVPLLKAAGLSIAMGNGDEAAKKAADIATEDIRHDGFFNAFKRISLI